MEKWKRMIATVAAGVIFAVNVPWTVSAAEEDSTYGDLTYTVLENGTIEITDCNEDATVVEIPAKIDGAMVTGIGENAFYGCKNLTDIIIPDSVVNIGSSAFENCTSLTELTIPKGVTYIPSWAFRNCSLTEITLPQGVTSIGSNAFKDCTGLTVVTIPNSVTHIGFEAFGYCIRLTDVFYIGTEEKWSAVSIGIYNDELLDAVMHFIVYGDLDDDGKVTMTDAYQALIASSKIALGEDDDLTEAQFAAADVDGNGKLTIMDAYWILMYSSYTYIGEEITWEELLG